MNVIHAGLQEMQHLILPYPQLQLLTPADKLHRLTHNVDCLLRDFWLLQSVRSVMLECCHSKMAAAAAATAAPGGHGVVIGYAVSPCVRCWLVLFRPPLVCCGSLCRD